VNPTRRRNRHRVCAGAARPAFDHACRRQQRGQDPDREKFTFQFSMTRSRSPSNFAWVPSSVRSNCTGDADRTQTETAKRSVHRTQTELAGPQRGQDTDGARPGGANTDRTQTGSSDQTGRNPDRTRTELRLSKRPSTPHGADRSRASGKAHTPKGPESKFSLTSLLTCFAPTRSVVCEPPSRGERHHSGRRGRLTEPATARSMLPSAVRLVFPSRALLRVVSV
jgi:hypothetical protein